MNYGVTDLFLFYFSKILEQELAPSKYVLTLLHCKIFYYPKNSITIGLVIPQVLGINKIFILIFIYI